MKLIFYFLAIAIIGYHGTNAKHNKRQDTLVYEDKGVFAPMITDEVGQPVETQPGDESIREVVLPPRAPVPAGPEDEDILPEISPRAIDGDVYGEGNCGPHAHEVCPNGRSPPPGPDDCKCVSNNGISVTSSMAIAFTCVVTILFIH